MTPSSLPQWLGGILAILVALPATAQTINFESIPSGTLVRDQFQSQGVRLSGTGTFSGLAYSEGQFGVVNYGNSPTRIVDIGQRSQPTTIRFVNPLSPGVTIGATAVSFLVGDGDPDSETFAVTYYDVAGAVLLGPVTHTTASAGLLLSQTSATLGAPIGSVKLELLATSASGVTFDDLGYTLAPAPGLCSYPFTSASGASHISYCLTGTGTIVNLQSPAGQEHVNVGQVTEGFVVCAGTAPAAWDLSSDAFGFGAPSVLSGPTSTGITLRQASPQFLIDQAFKLDKTGRSISITTTVTNVSGAQINDVRLARAYDPDINGDAGDDVEVRTARSVIASDIDGLALAGTTWTLATDTAIDTNPVAACSPIGAANPAITGDGRLASVTYRLGTLKANAKKKVVFTYRMQ